MNLFKFNKDFFYHFLIFSFITTMFILFCGCVSTNNQIEDNILSNNIHIDENLVNTNFSLPSLFFENDSVPDDLSDEVDSNSFLRILSEMPGKSNIWLKDSLFWIDYNSNKTINILVIRQDKSLAASKRLAENDIKPKIDFHLKQFFQNEIIEAFNFLNIMDKNLLNFIIFNINDFQFIINQYSKEYYWQYISIKAEDTTYYFYRYYIYINFLFEFYQKLRNQFILKIYNQRLNDRANMDLLIKYFNNKDQE